MDIIYINTPKRKNVSDVFPTFPNRKWIWPERDIDFLSGVGTGSADVDLICTARGARDAIRSNLGIGEFGSQSNAPDRRIATHSCLSVVGVESS